MLPFRIARSQDLAPGAGSHRSATPEAGPGECSMTGWNGVLLPGMNRANELSNYVITI